MCVHIEVVVVLPWVVLGDRAPGLRPLKDRDASCPGGDDLGILIVDGGGADDELHVRREVRGVVADVDLDALVAQPLDIAPLVHVGAGDDQTHPGEHLGQRGHGDASDADQMPLPAGG